MIEYGRAIIGKKPYIPCQYANKKMNGHIHEFPKVLEEIYSKLE